MNIFITLGTTPFDSFLKYIDNSKVFNGHDVVVQSVGRYKPVNISHFEFVDNIFDFYEKADLVITHAGAGSIYSLLEIGKNIIVVPNFERVDKHQNDISMFVERNCYGIVCRDFETLGECLQKYANGYVPKQYESVPFFKVEEIFEFLIN